MGPTCSGKSALAFEIAAFTGGSIVAVDARTSYKALNIGTAKPSVEEQIRVPHFNIDVLDVSQRDSPKEFEKRLSAINLQLKHPVMYTGGSTLYLQQLLFGSDNIPERSQLNMHLLEQITSMRGKPFVLQWLRCIDPEYARQVDGFNGVRIFRAIDVWLQTGRPFSSYHTLDVTTPRIPLVFGIHRPWDQLKERIAERTRIMFDSGLVQEISDLIDSGASPDAPGFRTIGYREVLDGLTKQQPEAEMRLAVTANTIAYAKRQITWFKRWPFIHWFDANALNPEEILQAIVSKMGKFGSN